MTGPFVLLTALGAALAAATSSVLQHRSARHERHEGVSAARLLAGLAIRPLWLAGLLAAAAGLALHALALSQGRLAVVQPLLLSGLIFALPTSRLLEGRRTTAPEWGWAVILCAALAAFLLSARPSAGRVSIDADSLAATVVAAGATMVGLLFVERRVRRHRAAVLGIAAGVAYGAASALLKQTTAITAVGLNALFTSWPVYALIGVGAAALAINQLAYRAGPLPESLPALTISDPVVAIMIGAIAFRERITHTPLAVAIEVVSFAAMAVATHQLARRAGAPIAPAV